jgi:protein-S-isoprenylcysteine O-methyltransferase Ste14
MTHQQRDDLTGEHKLGDAGQIILIIIFMVTWISDTFYFKYSIFLNQYVSLVIRIPLAIMIMLFAVYLVRKGLSIVFGEERKTPRVIRKGVFNMVRHPIYFSEILFYLGFLLLSISLIAAFIWFITIGFLHYISRHEEKLLFQRFGDEYARYCQDVPMWIPRLIKKKSLLPK